MNSRARLQQSSSSVISRANKQHVIAKAILISENLHVLLKSEQEVMNSRDEASVRSLAAEKQRLLVELESLSAGIELQPVANGVVQAQEEDLALDVSKRKLRKILLECQQINRDNQALASVEVKHTRDALELLRSLMKMNDVAVYGEAGELSVSREKRLLGKF